MVVPPLLDQQLSEHFNICAAKYDKLYTFLIASSLFKWIFYVPYNKTKLLYPTISAKIKRNDTREDKDMLMIYALHPL